MFKTKRNKNFLYQVLITIPIWEQGVKNRVRKNFRQNLKTEVRAK